MSLSMNLRPTLARGLLLAAACLAGSAMAADDKLLAAAREQQPALIDSLREMVPIESGTTDPAGLSKIADHAEKLLPALRAKVAESRRVPDTETTIDMQIGRPPYAAGERGKALAEKARAIYAELDGRELAFIPGSGGGTDAGFAGRSGKPAVLESLGLAGWGYHGRDEYIEIDSIVPRLYLTTRLLQDLGAAR
jgi:acetylornithine deacetylase/succinyl-diaminopimelate desuccinylase-like protein